MSYRSKPLISVEYPFLSKNRHQLLMAKLSPVLSQMFGYHALLYSLLAEDICNNQLCIKQQIVIDEEGSQVSVKCHYEELPIASDTIDLAVLPAILQRSQNPHQVLREVERVLIPEGYVILIGRNPLSWQGAKQKLTQRNVENQLKVRDISRSRIADWFRLLGLETEAEINISVSNERLQKSTSYRWVKQLGQLFCDYFCSYYIIVARKKVSTLTPIRPSWRRNKHLVPPRLAEPSVKSQVEHWFKQFK